MSSYPLLQAMRAKRERIEAEIAAPYRAETIRANMLAVQEREARAGLERIMRSEMLPHILREIGHKLGEGVHREIMKAIGKQKGFSGTTTLELPTDMLLAADPKSVVARVVDWWKSETAPRMSLRAFKGDMEMKSHVTTLDIRLPEMGYREQVMDRI